MSNAAKHRKKAAEFEQLKQIDRAIASYVRAIEESEAEGEDVDVALLNKVGDLALRQGRVPDAVTYYERAVEHYATAGLFNNAIALCNKILRNAPGRSNVYFTLGRICGKKGLRGDATRNFLEYASRMQQEGRVEEAMRALSEVAELMPELTEVSRMVEEHAARAGVQLPRRRTPLASEVIPDSDTPRYHSDKSSNLVFLDVDYGAATARRTPARAASVGSTGVESIRDVEPQLPTPVAPSTALPTPTVARSLPFIELDDAVAGASEAVDVPAIDAPAIDAPALSTDSTDLGTLDLIELDSPALESPTLDNSTVEEVNAIDNASMPMPPFALDPVELEPLELAPIELDAIELPMIEWTDELTVASTAPIELEWTAFDDALAPDTSGTPDVELVLPMDSMLQLDTPLGDEVQDAAATAATDAAAIETPPIDSAATDFAVIDSTVIDSAIIGGASAIAADVPEQTTDDRVEGLVDVASDDAIATPVDMPFVDAPIVDAPIAEAPVVDALVSDASSAHSPSGDALLANGPITEMPLVEATGTDEPLIETRVTESLVTESPIAEASEPTTAIATPPFARPSMRTPVRNAARTPSRTPMRSLEIPSIEAAIEAGAQLAARMASDSAAQHRRPPFRIDPHDFILPGELPPLLVDDDLVNAGLDHAVEVASAEAANARALDAASPTPARTPAFTPTHAPALAASTRTPTAPSNDAIEVGLSEATSPEASVPRDVAVVASDSTLHDLASGDALAAGRDTVTTSSGEVPSAEAPDTIHQLPTHTATDAELLGAVPNEEFETDTQGVAHEADASTATSAAAEQEGTFVSQSAEDSVGESAPGVAALSTPAFDEADVIEPAPAETTSAETPSAESISPETTSVESTASSSVQPSDDTPEFAPDEPPIAVRSAVRLTPALPIAAVAAEAKQVALSRREELRAAVAAAPQDWALRRRLAEALFEVGQRDAALAEMETALNGFAQSGQLESAADLSEELVRIFPDRVAYHQKRVELAVRLKDQQRLRFAYLDLADTLVRSGEEGRAQAVYVRVLEIDPRDDRARAALGSAAPPLPAPVAAPVADGFVNLADWLREDDGPASTRMRMREPEVSGDEQADFDALLRHFKEGVSRSLGEEDYESRYDLGVAFKEMGLLDDAIAEFQKALRSKAHRLPAYEALGQCFVEQGRYQIAATVLSRALHEPGLNDEQRIGVLYLLAYSCEALQRWGEARSYFQRVYATDINFRDVAARLAALEQVAS